MSLPGEQLRACDCCARLDGDVSLKKCTFCSICNAWLCEKDRLDFVRRAKAFGQRVIRGLENWKVEKKIR